MEIFGNKLYSWHPPLLDVRRCCQSAMTSSLTLRSRGKRELRAHLPKDLEQGDGIGERCSILFVLRQHHSIACIPYV